MSSVTVNVTDLIEEIVQELQGEELGVVSPRVLVVEDDAGCRRTFTRTLRRAGYRVLAAEDGAEALRLYEEYGADVVLTDLFMPNVDGIDLILNLVLEHPELPVIAITGASPGNPRIRSAQLFGARRVLEKPCPGEQLTAAVADALGPAPGDDGTT